jgi:hypothetical protein
MTRRMASANGCPSAGQFGAKTTPCSRSDLLIQVNLQGLAAWVARRSCTLRLGSHDEPRAWMARAAQCSEAEAGTFC